jgi:cation diffusion facilitator CzcD-associated flavoprotein CzcO
MTQAFYRVCKRYPKQMRRLLTQGVKRQLPKGFAVDTHFKPAYNPWDQRFCAVPNGDLFAAIRSGSASVVTDRIQRFTPKGLLLESGTELEADVIVTATGLELLFLGGIDLRVDGEAVNPADRLTYKGMMLEGIPNLAIAIGYTNASWTLKCDLTCDYVCRLLNYMHTSGLTEGVPRDRDGSMSDETMMGLTSGYIQRSAHLLPKQGARYPWKVHMSYLRDYRALKMTQVDDGYMEFRAVPLPGASGSASAADELSMVP